MYYRSAHTGVLLINLGSPAAPDKPSVRAYLAEFLGDKRVIDLATPLRQLLVKGLILPFRPKWSANAYRQIWTDQGSPLLINSLQLKQALATALGENYVVALGMNYGQPSIAAGLQELQAQKCRKLLIIPLFPQYSSAATGAAIEKTLSCLQQLTDIPEISICNSFYDHPAFIGALHKLITAYSPPLKPEMWIFSYHGLPVRQLNKRGCDTATCLSRHDCGPVSADNQHCYRRQCLATATLLAQALELKPGEYQIAFQSRLGRTPWLTPYTDQLLAELAGKGIKHVAIICPSFVADCLETLEEIGIRARAQWHKLGGAELTLLPSLNAHPLWVNALREIITAS